MELGKIKNYSQTSKLEILKHLKEGKVFNVDENTDLKTSEVSTSIPKNAKIEKDDKKAFEEYKDMYNDIITQKCIEDYGTDIDKQLWEDTAKELFLKTKTYIPTGEEKSQGTLDKKEENKLQLESRDRVAENLSKFIYDLTTDKDTETYGETAWSGNQPTKMGNGVTVYEVYKNGKSNYTMDDIKKAVLEKFPELDVYGTSYSSIFFYKPQKTENKLQEDTTNLEYNYMLLDRLKQDCEYFLGNGNGNVDTLWAKDIDEQIAKMKELYNSFADDEKPEWITIEDINNYEKKMKALKDSKEKKTEVTEKDLDNEDKKEETVVTDYTLSEIKKIIDSNGNDFTIKIVNSNEDVETKTLNIDREDLINIYNVLGNNKITENKITESLTEKDDIIKAIQNCYDEEQLEDVIYSVQDEKLSDILMENALDLKSEMENSKSFNKMKTYKQNLVNVVIDYFEDPDMFE